MLSDASAITFRNRIRSAQVRVSAADRKRRTRRLILIGSYMEHVTGDDPDKRDRLIKGTRCILRTGSGPGTVRLGPK